MASLPKLEKFLFTISTGITGLELLKEFGVETNELEYFINYCRETPDLSVNAMGPSYLIERYTPQIKSSYDHIISEMKAFSKTAPKEKIGCMITELEALHDLISRVYNVSKVTITPF